MRKRDESILVRLTEDEKELFERHVEDAATDEDNLSALMRIGARQIIKSDDSEASIDEQQLTRAISEAMGDVNERLERIEDGLAQIDAEVSIEEKIEDLSADLESELPVLDSPEEFIGQLKLGKQAENSSSIEFAQKLSTAGAWADYLDTDTNRARRALTRAVEQYPDVTYTEDEQVGKRRYYRSKGNI